MLRPKLFKLAFYDGPPANPFASEWPEMPREVFRTSAEAGTAALFWVKSFEDGGYDMAYDWWWARDQIAEDHFRFTRIVVTSA